MPTPDISWYLDGKLIRPDDYHKMLVCEKSVHSFIIEIVTIHHAGVYECVAKNRAGESHFSLRLDVIGEQPFVAYIMLRIRRLQHHKMRKQKGNCRA